VIAIEKARAHLEHLGLTGAAAVLDSRLQAASQEELPYADFLADLLGAEADARRERYLRTRTRLAHLPFTRSLEQFDFTFQPSIDQRQVRELATLSFVADAANVILLGPPGVGKTHLAVGLAIRAIEHGFGAYFVRAHDLLEDLRRAQADHHLSRPGQPAFSPFFMRSETVTRCLLSTRHAAHRAFSPFFMRSEAATTWPRELQERQPHFQSLLQEV
jgi:DNA replication protein DnaC